MTNTDIMLNAAKEIVDRCCDLPLIVGYEIYEYLGQTVSITEMRSLVGPSVIIETQLGESGEVELSELKLRRPRGDK
jgi:hypothetical protein